jgi:hypothetical protein
MITRSLIAAACLSATSAFAGQLDLAIIQYSNGAPAEEISAAMSSVRLAEMTNADKTQTRARELQGGKVLFAQSLDANPGSKFANSTRLGNNRADVKGSLGKGYVQAEITLSEGVRSGLRNFDQKTYAGRATIVPGTAKVLSIKETRVKAPSVVKGKAKLETSSYVTLVVAQYRP